MVVLKNTDCYMWRITDDERSSIHTDTGLRAVEVSCLLGAVLLFIPYFWISIIYLRISIIHLWISLIYLWISSNN